jgi:hypothetical protein|tara:strand:+ start:144 stop:1058 length:915 start_codon:yes stop_codon:yes gene_type:complete
VADADIGATAKNVTYSIGGIGSGDGLTPFSEDIGNTTITDGGTTPIEYIKFLVGDDIFNLFGDLMINQAFEQAFREVIGVVLDKHILENVGESTRYVTSNKISFNTAGFSYNKRILDVYRQETDAENIGTGDERYYSCRKSSNRADRLINPDSIYYENDPFSPIYCIDDDGSIKIFPCMTTGGTQPAGKVYYISYPNFGVGVIEDELQTHHLGNLSHIQNFSLVSSHQEQEIFFGLPRAAWPAVYYSMAINLCMGIMSNNVHEEEDTELVSLLNAQLQLLGEKRKAEFDIVVGKFGAGLPGEAR